MLDPTRRGRIESAVDSFGEFCRVDPQLSVVLAGDPFLQGSVATGTAVRPLSSDEFDVDVIFPFALARFNPPYRNPKSIFDWFISRLRTRELYANRLIPKDRCARIDYAGDFHVDIIPSTADVTEHRPYAVPARDLSDWISNDPLGFGNWVASIDQRGNGQDGNGDGYFVRCVRYMKRWRDEVFGEESAVSSILLVTMLGKHDPSIKNYYPALTNPLFPEYQTDAAYLYDMLRLTHSCLQQPVSGAFCHPTLPNEDLASGWDDNYLALFLQRLDQCINYIWNGIIAQTEPDTIQHYRKAFRDTFPAA